MIRKTKRENAMSDTRKLAPYKPYIGQRVQMDELLKQRGITYAQQHRDAMKAYLKKELRK
jgi:hypothetical protein|tara:strand:- start:402 stop:581 length:180 start_codon:yes stop_codon:yes gene_type:complete